MEYDDLIFVIFFLPHQEENKLKIFKGFANFYLFFLCMWLPHPSQISLDSVDCWPVVRILFSLTGIPTFITSQTKVTFIPLQSKKRPILCISPIIKYTVRHFSYFRSSGVLSNLAPEPLSLLYLAQNLRVAKLSINVRKW